MEKFLEFRERYPLFRYNAYHIEETNNTITFRYDFEIVGLPQFHPTWTIDKQHVKYFDENDEIIQKLIFSIGMVELSSYWKITCSPAVEIHAGAIDDTQLAWWKKQYFLGLQEFFYTNHITVSIDDFMYIKALGSSFADTKGTRALSGCMIPIGGGKDSAVTTELCKQLDMKRCAYIINTRKATQDTVDIGGFDEKDVIKVKRTLDANMLECNKKGFLNGHTPFSALVAFSSTLFAYMNDLRYVVLSNEDSANESTVAGTQINHQYSKSFQFEQDFHEYEKAYIDSGVYYFSLLRGWSEFQIAEHFAKYPQYHEAFRSCNVGSKADIWCGSCPKCLFVYFILMPFLSDDELHSVFRKNLLEDQALIQTMEQLIGYQSEKPFECVGSRSEVNTAICMKIAALEKEGKALPLLLRRYQTLPQYESYRNQKNPYAHYFNQENLIPDIFLPLVKEG